MIECQVVIDRFVRWGADFSRARPSLIGAAMEISCSDLPAMLTKEQIIGPIAGTLGGAWFVGFIDDFTTWPTSQAQSLPESVVFEPGLGCVFQLRLEVELCAMGELEAASRAGAIAMVADVYQPEEVTPA